MLPGHTNCSRVLSCSRAASVKQLRSYWPYKMCMQCVALLQDPQNEQTFTPGLRRQGWLCCLQDAHAIVVLTEWEEFKPYNYEAIYETMVKPAFIFDGRNVLNHERLRSLGFIVYALGKPLDPFIQKVYS